MATPISGGAGGPLMVQSTVIGAAGTVIGSIVGSVALGSFGTGVVEAPSYELCSFASGTDLHLCAS